MSTTKKTALVVSNISEGEGWIDLLFKKDEEGKQYYHRIHQFINNHNINHICNKEELRISVDEDALLFTLLENCNVNVNVNV